MVMSTVALAENLGSWHPHGSEPSVTPVPRIPKAPGSTWYTDFNTDTHKIKIINLFKKNLYFRFICLYVYKYLPMYVHSMHA